MILRQIQELGAAAGIATSGAETNLSNGSRKSSRSSNCSSSRKSSSAAVMSENGRRSHQVRKVRGKMLRDSHVVNKKIFRKDFAFIFAFIFAVLKRSSSARRLCRDRGVPPRRFRDPDVAPEGHPAAAQVRCPPPVRVVVTAKAMHSLPQRSSLLLDT